MHIWMNIHRAKGILLSKRKRIRALARTRLTSRAIAMCTNNAPLKAANSIVCIDFLKFALFFAKALDLYEFIC